jgi:hypothetical protein
MTAVIPILAGSSGITSLMQIQGACRVCLFFVGSIMRRLAGRGGWMEDDVMNPAQSRLTACGARNICL